MAYFLCTHYEDTRDLLDFARTGHTLPREMPPPQSTQADPVRENSEQQDIQRMVTFLMALSGKPWKDNDLDFFFSLDNAVLARALGSQQYADAGFTPPVLLSIMLFILSNPQRWFQYASSSSTLRALWRLMAGSVANKQLLMFGAGLGARLLAAVGVGLFVRTIKVPGGGIPIGGSWQGLLCLSFTTFLRSSGFTWPPHLRLEHIPNDSHYLLRSLFVPLTLT